MEYIEIEISKELDMPIEDCDEEEENELKDEGWDDLGIEQFAVEVERTTATFGVSRSQEVPSVTLPPN